MTRILKATLNFFKKKSVQLWALIMVGVTAIGFGIMSWVMVANKVVFTELEFATWNATTNAPNTDLTGFDFIPNLDFIDTITISNNNENLSGTRQLNNNMPDGVFDPVFFENEARIVNNILDRLDRGRRTNSFMQFFTNGQGDRERDGRVVNTHTGSWRFEELSDGIWLRITFLTPQFVVNPDITGPAGRLPWHIEKFNPHYVRPTTRDANDIPRAVPGTLTINQYNNHVINAIHIPLGHVTNRVTEQTWYISVGSTSISNTTSMGFTFTTFGNYHRLLRYIRDIDDEYLL
jgi:hypothetical protein